MFAALTREGRVSQQSAADEQLRAVLEDQAAQQAQREEEAEAQLRAEVAARRKAEDEHAQLRAEALEAQLEAQLRAEAEARAGLGRIVALYFRSSASYQIHDHIRYPCF